MKKREGIQQPNGSGFLTLFFFEVFCCHFVLVVQCLNVNPFLLLLLFSSRHFHELVGLKDPSHLTWEHVPAIEHQSQQSPDPLVSILAHIPCPARLHPACHAICSEYLFLSFRSADVTVPLNSMPYESPSTWH